jgi:arylsulfatase A-like enzyme
MTKSPRGWFISVLTVLCLLTLEAAGLDTRPNLILILTDDQRQDTLGCTGNAIVKTPHIDKLAAEGTLFTQATVTSAICTPSRASFFSGMHERNHGVNFNSGTALSLVAWDQCYPMLLRNAGYFIGYVGKNHVPVGRSGYASGIMEATFDYWYAGHGHLTFYPKERGKNAMKLQGIDERMFHNAKEDTQVEILAEGALNFLEPNQAFYDQASRFLQERPDDRPFCLTVSFNLPHDAGTRSMKLREGDADLYKTAYRDKAASIRADLPGTYIAKADIRRPKLPSDILYPEFRQPLYDYVDDPDTLVERITRRYQAIEGIDRMIGQLRKQLEELNLDEDTIIVFSSDHGIMRGEFGLGGKSLNYDPCLRVPLIVYDPKSKAKGQEREEAVQSIDVTATLLNYAGVNIPDHMTGASLKPLIEGYEVEWRDYAFSEALWCTAFGMPRIESVRGQGWKYIRYYRVDRELFDTDTEGLAKYKVSNRQAEAYQGWLTASIEGARPDHEELYNLENDPEEIRNLAGHREYEGKLNELRSICQAAVAQARGEPFPIVDLELERADYVQWKKNSETLNQSERTSTRRNRAGESP